jgi:hypothetical protein
MNFLKRVCGKFVRYRSLFAAYRDEQTVFIYQMGKVGSTSLEHVIPGGIHIHAFYLDNHTCPIRKKGLAGFGLMALMYWGEQQLLALLLRWVFKRRKFTKIITLVRDPIERNISMFFHDIDAYLFAAHTNCMRTRQAPLMTRSQSTKLLTDVFNHDFDHHYPLTWFDREFLKTTGIDIFATPFDKSLGYSQVSTEKYQILCVDTKRLKSHTDKISSLIGRQVELTYQNQTSNKWYADVYHQFVLNYVTPEHILSDIQKSRYYQHFFDV